LAPVGDDVGDAGAAPGLQDVADVVVAGQVGGTGLVQQGQPVAGGGGQRKLQVVLTVGGRHRGGEGVADRGEGVAPDHADAVPTVQVPHAGDGGHRGGDAGRVRVDPRHVDHAP